MKTTRIEGNPCHDCLLDGNKVSIKGPRKARFLVVSKPTTKNMAAKNQNLTTAAMKLFASNMKKHGFVKSDFVFTNCIRCGFDSTEWVAKDRRVIATHCREHLLRLIEKMRPEAIITLGVEAASSVFGRQVKITKVRGVPKYVEELDTYVFPMLDPSYVHINPQHKAIFASDCKFFGRLVDYDFDLEAAQKDIEGTYRLIDDLQFLVDQKPKVLSFDLETLGTRWYEEGGKILTMQFCTKEGEAYVLPWDHPDKPLSLRQKRKIKRQLRKLLQNPKTSVIGHNIKFDARWIYQKLGFWFRMDHDTLLMASIIDENMQNKDLDTLVKVFVPEMGGYADRFNSGYDKSRMDLVPLDEIVSYGAGDVDAVLRLYRVFRKKIYDDEKLWNYYRRVAIPGINAFVRTEIRGLLVDEKALNDLEKVLADHVEELRVKLLKQVPRSIKRAHAEKGLKFTRKDFLVDILFKHPDGFRLEPKIYTESTKNLPDHLKVPSTSSKDHLPFFFDDPVAGEFCIDLAEWIKLDRLLNTNIRRFREKYIYEGKIYPTYTLWVTVTGRTSSQDPNNQNWPKRGTFAKQYRKIFIPEPGKVMLEADLSQAELRISADMANEPLMIEIYQSGGDIHRYTAAIVMGISLEEFNKLPPEEQSLARFKAKAVNFGFCALYTDMVLCRTRGEIHEKQIRYVTIDDEVWDGENWVRHKGKIYQGEKECFWYDGFAGTADHECFVSPEKKIPLEEAIATGVSLCKTGRRGSPVSCKEKSTSRKREGQKRRWKIFDVLDRVPSLRGMALAFKTNIAKGCSWLPLSWDGEVDKRSETANAWFTVRCHGSALRKMDSQIFLQLQRKRDKGFVSLTRRVYQMGARYLARRRLQGKRVRQDRQQWALFSRQSAFSHIEGEQKKYSEKIAYDCISWQGYVVGGFCAEVFPIYGKEDIQLVRRAGHEWRRSSRTCHTHTRKSFWQMVRFVGSFSGKVARYCKKGATKTCNFLQRRIVDTARVQGTYWLRVFSSIIGFIRFVNDGGADIAKEKSALMFLVSAFRNGKAGISPSGRVWVNLGIHPTYDLYHAGPNKRFTVNGCLVSNCYGMGWRKFIIYAKTQYGVEFTEEEAQRVRVGFFSRYSNLPLWHQAVRDFVRKHGYVRSYSGRIRHLPMVWSEEEYIRAEAERQAINSPVQNFASDLGVMAVSRIEQDISDEYLAITGFVHDAIYAMVPEEYVEWGAKTLKYYMETDPIEEWFGVKMKVPIIADVGFGWNGGETYELEGLSADLDEPYDFEAIAYDPETNEYKFELPHQKLPPNMGRKKREKYMVIDV